MTFTYYFILTVNVITEAKDCVGPGTDRRALNSQISSNISETVTEIAYALSIGTLICGDEPSVEVIWGDATVPDGEL